MTAIPVREHTLDLIGNTPLVRLEGPSAEAGCDIFGKCEFANPISGCLSAILLVPQINSFFA